MVLPASGAISIDDLKAEFSSSANDLNSYYRGGGIVPDTGTNSSIPTSGAITIPDDFWGSSNAGGGGDVTPNSVNWTNISGDGAAESNSQDILGIDTTIALEAVISITSGNVLVIGKKNGVITGGTITGISSGDAIIWSASTFGGGTASISIRNNTDGNTVLDTFSVTLTDSGV